MLTCSTSKTWIHRSIVSSKSGSPSPSWRHTREAHEHEQELVGELEIAAGELKTLELEFDKSEGELQILESKLKEHETRLFAGGMSGRETEHMRLEVQSLHGQREAL